MTIIYEVHATKAEDATEWTWCQTHDNLPDAAAKAERVQEGIDKGESPWASVWVKIVEPECIEPAVVIGYVG